MNDRLFEKLQNVLDHQFVLLRYIHLRLRHFHLDQQYELSEIFNETICRLKQAIESGKEVYNPIAYIRNTSDQIIRKLARPKLADIEFLEIEFLEIESLEIEQAEEEIEQPIVECVLFSFQQNAWKMLPPIIQNQSWMLKRRLWQVFFWGTDQEELSCLHSRLQDSPGNRAFISTLSLQWRQLWEEFLQSSCGAFAPPDNQKLIEEAC